jgi:hypothetical protein
MVINDSGQIVGNFYSQRYERSWASSDRMVSHPLILSAVRVDRGSCPIPNNCLASDVSSIERPNMIRSRVSRGVCARRASLGLAAALAGLVAWGPNQPVESDAAAATGNPIQQENAKAGTSAWDLSNAASNHEIEGYASKTSVNLGGSISFFVNTIDSSYTLSIYRMGWYGGLGGRQVLAPVTLTGHKQTIPAPDPTPALSNASGPIPTFSPCRRAG